MRTGRLAGRDEPAGEAGARDVPRRRILSPSPGCLGGAATGSGGEHLAGAGHPRRRGLSGERVRRGPGAAALYGLTGIFSAPVPKGRA